MSNQIESMIVDLADHLVWPVDASSVERSVLGNLGGRHVRRHSRGRSLVYAVLAVFLISIVVYLVPPARQAVANLFGAAGIHIVLGDAPFQGAVGELELGPEVPISDLEDAVGFDVVAPLGSDAGPPDKVFLGESGEVNMAWGARPELPAAGDSGIGLLFTQRENGSATYEGVKTVSAGTEVEAVRVAGTQGFWIEGALHTLVLVDDAGVERDETGRLAANVLLWARDGINYRLETSGDLASALAIVETLAVLPD